MILSVPLASIEPFRLDFEGALSYFVGGNPNYPEDSGFALKPYISVFWENKGIRITQDLALTMGHYYFYDTPTTYVKVEYSFAYLIDETACIPTTGDNLKIVLQHSSLPFALKEG